MTHITKTQLAQMKHALGLNKNPRQDRNYFYCGSDSPEWNDLVKKGLAGKKSGWSGDSAYFYVTDAGIELLATMNTD
jgi:hypothetical protein